MKINRQKLKIKKKSFGLKIKKRLGVPLHFFQFLSEKLFFEFLVFDDWV